MMASRQELHGKPMFQTENFEARAGMAAGTSHGNEGPPVGPYVPNSNLLESVRAKMISTNDLISKFNKKSGVSRMN